MRSRMARTISLFCELAFFAVCRSIHSFTSAGRRILSCAASRLIGNHRFGVLHHNGVTPIWCQDTITNLVHSADMAKQDDYVRITLRLPPDLHRELAKSAGARSLNSEIVSRLERSISHGHVSIEQARRFADELDTIRPDESDPTIPPGLRSFIKTEIMKAISNMDTPLVGEPLFDSVDLPAGARGGSRIEKKGKPQR